MTGWGVFSTIRVASGVLFAFERHFARMKRDAALVRVPFPHDPDWLEERLIRLVQANDARDATLRVNVVRNNGGLFHEPVGRDFDVVAFTADLAKWGGSVRLGVMQQARHAHNVFAGTKVTSWAFNLCWYEQAHEEGLDEYVLLDETGHVSECTSANIFAVFGRDVVTPPLSCGCLPGITRELLLTTVDLTGTEESPYKIREGALTLADLERADSVFVTSSTRDLLPVASIEGIRVQQGSPACSDLNRTFQQYKRAYVESRAVASAR